MPLLVVLGCVAETPEPGGISTWTIGSEPVVTIGSIDGEAPYLLSGIQAVELLPDDRIAVIDGSSQTIRIYDASGLFERQLGGKGQGPGEFTDVYYLTSVHADTIVAYDVEALRFSVFLTSGELVSTCPVQVEDGQPSLYFGTYSNGDRGLGWIRSVERDQSVITADIMDLTGFGADGRAVTPLASLPGIRRFGLGPTPFSPFLASLLIGDSVFATDGLEAIDVIGPRGERIRSFRVPVERRSAEEAWAALDGSLQGSGFRDRLLALRGTAGVDSIPLFAEMLADDEQRLWLKAYYPETDNPYVRPRRTGGDWIIVDREGGALGRVSLPDRFRLLDVRGGRLAGVAYDSLGVERVRIYRATAP
jgi:hypothetical protein